MVKLTKKEIRGIVGVSALIVGGYMLLVLKAPGWWLPTLIGIIVLIIMKNGKTRKK